MGNWKAQSRNRSLNKIISLRTGVVLCMAMTTTSAWASKVLVIDQGVDLDHKGLLALQSRNQAESAGIAGVDDDKNGFVDDVMGWNSVSNDGVFFPPRIRQYFVQHHDEVAQAFQSVERIQEGDKSSVEACKVTDSNGKPRWKKEDPACMSLRRQILVGQTLMEFSHGTHVAGIVAHSSQGQAKIASLNIFNGGSDSVRIVEESPAATPTAPHASNSDTSRPNVFDVPQAPEMLVAQKSKSDRRSADTLSRFIRASEATVVNVSLATTELGVRGVIESAWKSELQRLSLDPSLKRNAQQQDVYNRLVAGLYSSAIAMWKKVLADNPNVLFVTAAGNDGALKEIPQAGNNEIYGVYPANASAEFANVLTVAATDERGALVDFSNYSQKLVNVGAPGKSILSYAPADLEVRMSGTSMAAPFVAGLASKMRSLNPQLTAAQVREILERTSRPTQSLSGKTSTGGVVNPEAAFAAASGGSPSGVLSILGLLEERLLPHLDLTWDDTHPGELALSSDFEKALAHRLTRSHESVQNLLNALR